MGSVRPRRASRGFTLLELVVVLALIAIVASVMVPLGFGALREGHQARADADLQQLATALTRFHADLRRLPSCPGPSCGAIIAAGSAANNGLRFLAVGEGRGNLAGQYPEDSPALGTGWNLAGHADPGRPARNNAFNHLVRNDPNADGVVDAQDYPRAGRAWNGPYLATLGLDPWGHAYVISVGAVELGGRPISPGAQAWVLSAGPNGILETTPDAVVLGGDDRGFIFAPPVSVAAR